jgi:hypothetical protein
MTNKCAGNATLLLREYIDIREVKILRFDIGSMLERVKKRCSLLRSLEREALYFLSLSN